MKNTPPNLRLLLLTLVMLSPFPSSSPVSVCQAAEEDDASAMQDLKRSLTLPASLDWSDSNPCQWPHIVCTANRVTRIQIGHQNLQGTLSPSLSSLTSLERLELQGNNVSGPLPSLAGLSSLQVIMLSNNQFTSIPSDFFNGQSSLQSVELDNNPFSEWEIPVSLKDASSLQNFSANSANITGKIPDFFGPDVFPSLLNLRLAINRLEGELPLSFSGTLIESFWVNGQTSDGKLSGSLQVIQNMTALNEAWLHSNAFTGPLPDFSGLGNLETFSARDNMLTGVVPSSLVDLSSLKVLNLTNNLLQGPMPALKSSVSADLGNGGLNSFCLSKPGNCSTQVNIMLSIAEALGYPAKFAQSWKGNDACASWFGVVCNKGNITLINFSKMGLNGTISPEFSSLKSLQRLILADNNLNGTIPEELTELPSLTELDVSNNKLYGKVPSFRKNFNLEISGNPDVGNDKPTNSSQSGPTPSSGQGSDNEDGYKSSLSKGVITILSILGGLLALFAIGVIAFCLYKRKQKRFSRVQSPNAMVVHPRHSGSDNDSVKITVAGSNVSVGGISDTHTLPNSETGDIQMVEAGNMVISIQVLRNVTDNFSEDNILGQGGFGTVYKGELHDGTKIAVKRMNIGVITGKGLSEFKSEIAVLTKVRHRHLVALLGYCLDGDEKLLVYEYMPQGTLSRHVFNWAQEGLKPLEWTKRLTIVLDVARGVEYLHTLAHQSFIHRDLKPSNILLGDDMRAKVADFGLVRLAPEGKGSIHTRIAGTFGYLAPEYAVTGRVTTKVDVYSFGVILMELITGRKAIDESQPEESMHLVTWFKRMHLNKETFSKAIDPSLDLDHEETLASIMTVAELAGHCCAREPHQRPDMGHAVNVLSSLVELWKPSELSSDDIYGINLDMSLPQALKKWQALEGRSQAAPAGDSSSSSFVASHDNTQTSIPTRPYGFAESFTSADGR